MLLEKQIGDTMSLHSMSQAQPFGSSFNNRMPHLGMARIDTMSELLQEPVEERRCETERAQPQPNPLNFIDNMRNVFERTITEVKSMVAPSSTTDETRAHEPLKMPEIISEVQKPVEQQPELIDTSSSQKKDESKGANLMKCTWCSGKTCKKCKHTGFFYLENMEEAVAGVREEIKKLCDGGLKNLLDDHKREKGQASVRHEGYICDGCEADPIVGIRYKSTNHDDFDICEKCERKCEFADHTFLKIRYPHQAPAKLVCKYPEQTKMQMPDMHIDQTIKM